MKNLKKVLALVLACAMTLSVMVTAGAAGYPDVAADATYAEAVTVLSALGIIKGDENGNFNPDKTITRAEMAKILCTMLGSGELAERETIFADVPATHWASGYVAYAQQYGAIDGYGDGNYGPEDPVTYEQVIKLIMSAMGYSIKANDMGGYPTGYLMVAADKDITANAAYSSSAAAPRSVVAVLVYNALNTPIMEKVSYGTEEIYREMDGENGYAFKSLLTSKLKTFKVEGVVTSTLAETKDYKEGHITYHITNAGKIDAEEKLGASKTGVLKNIDASSTNAKDLLYLASVAYVKVNSDNDKEIVCVAAKTGKNVTIDIPDATQIWESGDASIVKNTAEHWNMDSNNGKRIFAYWEDREEDTRIKTAVLDANTTIVRDNKDMGEVKDTTTLAELKPAVGSVKLIDTDDDGDYDLIVVKEYGIAVVQSADGNKNRINFKSGAYMNSYLKKSYVILDKDVNTDLVEYSITLDGKAATVADLQEYDVLNICTDDLTNPMFVEIIATRNAVEGAVGEINDTTKEIYINDEAYELNENVPNMSLSEFKTGDAGVYYLDKDNKIVYQEAASRASKNYAYLYKTGSTTFGDVVVRMFTVEGADVSVDVYSKVKINDVNTDSLNDPYDDADVANMFGLDVKNDAATIAAVKAEIVDPETFITKLVAGTLTEASKLMTGNADADKLVTFKLDSDNYLREINVPVNFGNDDEVFGYVGTVANKEWKKNLQKFEGSKGLTDDAKVFHITTGATADIADFKVADVASLVDGREYDPYFYGYTEDGMSVVAFYGASTSKVDQAANLAIMTKATKALDDEENNVYKVYYIQNGKAVETPIMVEDVVYEGATDLKAGSAFLYTVNDKGIVDDIEVVFAAGKSAPAKLQDAIKVSDALIGAKKDGSGNVITADWIIAGDAKYADTTGYDNEVYYGLVLNVKGNRVTLTNELGKNDDAVQTYIVPEELPVLVYRPAYSSDSKIYTEGTVADVVASLRDADGNVELVNDPELYYCFVRLYNDEVVDVIFVDYARN